MKKADILSLSTVMRSIATINDEMKYCNMKTQLCLMYNAKPWNGPSTIDLIHGVFSRITGTAELSDVKVDAMIVFHADGADYPFDKNIKLKVDQFAGQYIVYSGPWSSYTALIRTTDKNNKTIFTVM
jgi:hypothetical protein